MDSNQGIAVVGEGAAAVLRDMFANSTPMLRSVQEEASSKLGPVTADGIMVRPGLFLMPPEAPLLARAVPLPLPARDEVKDVAEDVLKELKSLYDDLGNLAFAEDAVQRFIDKAELAQAVQDMVYPMLEGSWNLGRSDVLKEIQGRMDVIAKTAEVEIRNSAIKSVRCAEELASEMASRYRAMVEVYNKRVAELVGK
jgi:hypothetical protein